MYEKPIVNLGGGNSKIVYFHSYLGKIPILINIFQMDWNHQLEMMRDKLPNYQPQLVEVGFLNHQPYHTEYTAKKNLLLYAAVVQNQIIATWVFPKIVVPPNHPFL